ncbi:hypothetical protein HYDPIDRAFT_112773 [Hydnomerulius pinastri MD-312]|uniref:Uncharacterized protein n=1 Tax=Hydnomerulius pinastri MD-312 TaxID=994086 RepID=A0A0C9WEB8_9AGAM|nr:hypothetical protein HYDPIDRAFT_112773 [Hydnomerulius pinastri MD-312]
MSTLPPKKTVPGVWSFNHRVGGGYISDCSSDSEPETETNNPSDDTRLLREMDLSIRQETVVYRPNPWSIAKINAGSRDAPPKPTKLEPRAPPKAPTKRILDAFKKQAEHNARRAQQPINCDPGTGNNKAAILEGKSNQSRDLRIEDITNGPSVLPTKLAPGSAEVICPQVARIQPPQPLDHRGLRVDHVPASAYVLGVSQDQKPAHTSSFSEKPVYSNPPRTVPSHFRRAFGTRPPQSGCHRANNSSPVRPSFTALSSGAILDGNTHRPAQFYNNDVNRDRLMIYHSSPGPPSNSPGALL